MKLLFNAHFLQRVRFVRDFLIPFFLNMMYREATVFKLKLIKFAVQGSNSAGVQQSSLAATLLQFRLYPYSNIFISNLICIFPTCHENMSACTFLKFNKIFCHRLFDVNFSHFGHCYFFLLASVLRIG